MAGSRVVVDSSGITRISVALLFSLALVISPLWAVPSSPIGTVVFANRARVGSANTSVGATVFSGDRLSTDSSASSATLTQQEAGPSASLTSGTATFSTANAKAFALHFASAVIRPDTNLPTIGKVTVLSAKELLVKCVRGSLQIAVEDDVREIPEGAAYRVVLDPNAPDPQGPRGAGTKGMGGPPVKGAKSRFIWYAIAVTGGVTFWVAYEAFESSYKP